MEVIAASAPELQVAQWFNTDAPVTLTGLRGKVVLVYAFQMLCPGCVTHTIPQAIRLDALAERLAGVDALVSHERHGVGVAVPQASYRPCGRACAPAPK